MTIVRKPIRSILAIALLAAASAPPAPAGAAETKAAVTQKSKSAAIEITIDPALKAYPGLYENLLAEGRRDAAKWRKDADADLREQPQLFAKGKSYSYERSYKRRSAFGHYVAVLRDDSTYTLGAHPNAYTDTILWDSAAKKRVGIRPFFKETADTGPTMTALAKLARAAACAAKQKRASACDKPEELTSIEPKLIGIGPVTPAPSTEPGKSSGLTFHYSPYGIGAYAEGPYTVFVPWTDFKDFLSAEGLAVFGGTRPDGDAGELE